MLAAANRAQDESAAGQGDIFGALGEPEPLRVPPYAPWVAAERLQREYDAIGFFLSGHPLDDYQGVLARLRVQSWADFAKSVKAGATMGKIAATVLDRQERRTKSGSKMGIFSLSDQTGHFEAIIFSEGLNQYRDLLEPGRAVVLTVQASVEGEEVRARIGAAEALDKAAEKLTSAMRIYLRDEKPLMSIAERLKERGDGEVSVVLMLDGGRREVEISLGKKFKASPQVASALKAVHGVVQVEMV
jgi:DNA polymerase-3 subunit alpha